ncbi:MAG: glycosyltransferase family 39 protein [Rhodocyclaceae bacterium]|nr:glycosyltransferase family 39 protein [Rhodocyclaceae bacterium]
MVRGGTLYHWLAAMVGTVLGSILPFHEGARMAAALLGGLFFVGLAAAARRMFGREAGWAAPLLAIGTLGLLVPMHEAQPTTTILATITAVYWGAARLAEHPKTAGLLMGAGLGATFLAGGLIAVLPTLTLLAIPLWRRHWLATTAAVGLGTAIALAWPVTLALAHPEHLAGWWANELATIAPRNPLSLAHVEWLGWFAWPVLLIAAWMVWRGRRRLTARRWRFRRLVQSLPCAGCWPTSPGRRPPCRCCRRSCYWPRPAACTCDEARPTPGTGSA